MLPFLHELEEYVSQLKAKSGFRLQPRPLLLGGLVLLLLAFLFMPRQVSTAVSISFFLMPLWLPVLLLFGAWHIFVVLKRSEFIASQKYVLLEIKPPRTLEKTPLAMEAVLSGMHLGPGEGNWYAKYIQGKVRPWWSLEIVSIEGQVHFFIWTRVGFRRIIETQIYAQYPGAQVTEAPDYTRLISATPEEWTIWGCDFLKTAADPIPVKTYIEYGLDKVQKEPEQIDPLANLIEFMGSMGKGENVWLQLIIRVHKGEKYDTLNDKGKPYTWKDEAQKVIKSIQKESRDPGSVDPVTHKEKLGIPNPTKGQSDKIAAIERNISKLAFDVGVRAIYLATPQKFDPLSIAGLTGIFKQFSSESWNGFKPDHWMTQFNDYPWEMGVDRLKTIYRRALVEAYRRRQFYFEPFDFKSDAMVMSTEELATIFHIPSRAIGAPGLDRIQSTTSEAPANLPV
jgi:hypothetical protein